jgi:hypothetical protein
MINFGVYILTFPRDYHLAGALINSLKHFAPNVPVMIVPGTGFDILDHPFEDIPVMEIPTDETSRFDYYDRKLWVFNGPFDKFLYMDSDVLCISSFNDLIPKIEAETGPFIYVSLGKEFFFSEEWINSKTQSAASEFLKSGQLGNVDNIRSFDPSYDFSFKPMFNSGLFASSRQTIGADDLIDLHHREINFYAQVLNKHFSGRCMDLFFGDQGKINYLVNKKNVTIKPLCPNGFKWGGETVATDEEAFYKEYSFIHWAGCPRPSVSIFARGLLFKLYLQIYRGKDYSRLKNEKQVPGLDLWLRFNSDQKSSSVIRQSYEDAKKVARYFVSRNFHLL